MITDVLYSVNLYIPFCVKLSHVIDIALWKCYVLLLLGDFSLRVNFHCRLLYRVLSVQPPCAISCISIYTQPSPTLAAIPLFGHKKILHRPIRAVSAFLAAAVPNRVRRPEFPEKDNEAINKQTKHLRMMDFIKNKCPVGFLPLKFCKLGPSRMILRGSSAVWCPFATRVCIIGCTFGGVYVCVSCIYWHARWELQ